MKSDENLQTPVKSSSNPPTFCAKLSKNGTKLLHLVMVGREVDDDDDDYGDDNEDDKETADGDDDDDDDEDGVITVPPPHSAGPGADHTGLGLWGSPPVFLPSTTEIQGVPKKTGICVQGSF